MNFKNTASTLQIEAPPELKAWRHEMLCTLISSGVTNPKELIATTEELYRYIVQLKVSPSHSD